MMDVYLNTEFQPFEITDRAVIVQCASDTWKKMKVSGKHNYCVMFW